MDLRRLASIYIDVPALRPGTVGAYSLAALSVLAALAARIVLDPYLQDALYILFYPAVLITTLISGFGAGLLSAVLSIAAAWFFLVPPRTSFGMPIPEHALGLALFGIVTLGNVVVAAGMRFAIERYRDISRNLERSVEDRTAELDDKNRQLREANDEFMAIYDRGDIFMGRLDLQGILVDANRACIEGLGFARADIVGKPLWKGGWWRISPEVEEWIRRSVEQALAGEPSRGETSFVTGNGEERVTEIALMPIRDDAGRVASVFAAGLDVTERARQYQAIFENAGVGIAHVNADLKFVRVNEALRRLVGYSASELTALSVPDLTHPEDRETTLADIERMRDGKIDGYDAEKRYLRKDGTTVWVRVSITAVRKGDGSIERFISVILDISARKQAEQLLQRQADLLNQSHEAISTWKIGGPGRGIVYWSRGAEILYGYTASEAKGRISHELLKTRATIPMEEIEAQVVRQGSWQGELTHVTRDGRQIAVGSSMVRVSYDGEPHVLETNRDITERKLADEQVRLLLREMNHRGKNMLTLVQAVARQTATSDPEHFIERFTDRIQALAANQDLLIQARSKGIEVDDLVRAQLAHFSDLIGCRISLNGPTLHLLGAAAQAIGMALHELATNASKYGALSTDTGHVDIGWQIDGDLFEMHWTERNGPPVRPPDRRGFGSTVIEKMAKRAVDGEVQLEYDPEGLSWRLTCPAANAMEPG
jgi:PAS domain S-box-containing protein